jgi:hypothetical protein
MSRDIDYDEALEILKSIFGDSLLWYKSSPFRAHFREGWISWEIREGWSEHDLKRGWDGLVMISFKTPFLTEPTAWQISEMAQQLSSVQDKIETFDRILKGAKLINSPPRPPQQEITSSVLPHKIRQRGEASFLWDVGKITHYLEEQWNDINRPGIWNCTQVTFFPMQQHSPPIAKESWKELVQAEKTVLVERYFSGVEYIKPLDEIYLPWDEYKK